jgi:hypothetical protein
MTTSALVGPLPTITFWDGTRVAYTPPRDTLDLRYATCRDHHPACDCREAEMAEERSESRLESRNLRAAFDRILAGHLTRTYDGRTPCQCTGCQIARAAHAYPLTAARR